MPKFHDEFFAQKGKEHDDLVAEVLFNIEAVAELLQPTPEPLDDHIHLWFYCPLTGKGHTPKGIIVRKDDGDEINAYCCGNRIRHVDFYGDELCEQWKIFHENNEKSDYYCSFDTERNDGSYVYKIEYPYEYTRKITKETEHIFYGYNKFILGYGDIILDVTDEFKAYNRKYVLSEITNSVSYVIDCKPKIDDMGAVARQIKTYADLLKGSPVKVIVTCQQELSRSTKIIAANENIVLIIYDKDKRQFTLAPPLLVETKLE